MKLWGKKKMAIKVTIIWYTIFIITANIIEFEYQIFFLVNFLIFDIKAKFMFFVTMKHFCHFLEKFPLISLFVLTNDAKHQLSIQV